MTYPLSTERLRSIIDRVQYKDRTLLSGVLGEGHYVQVSYQEADIHTGVMETQYGRKWYLHPHASETEVVETCFKAIRVSNDHVLKEHFTYRGRRVYSPHFDINARIQMCDEDKFD